MSFQKDLQRGLEVEEIVLGILRKKYPSASLINAFKGYDIWIPEIDKAVEVKYDPMSQETGNIVIEIEMYDKPSGLITTQADFWVFYDGEMFVIMPVKHIFKCIFDCKLQYVEFVERETPDPKRHF